ncbi:uncharacterized protein LOC135841417 [Planococcus citri]|uniref:uncharacterized protein LOC135841417 n=1 Tax=Planococcus citri TaxID=170843 RepID=UPI0031F767A2
MFRKTWLNLCRYRFKPNTLSNLPLEQNIASNPSSSIVLNRLIESSPSRCYCVKTDDLGTHPDPNQLISSQYEIQECHDNSPSTADSTIKYTTYKDRCVRKITEAFKFSDIEALHLYEKYPYLFHENICDTMKRIDILKDDGISEQSIFKSIEILELDDGEIKHKLHELTACGFNEEHKSDTFALLTLEARYFRKVTCIFKAERDKIPEGNRLIHFSNIFQCSLAETVDLSLKYRYLLNRSFNDLTTLFKHLLDYGISRQSIRNNLWFTSRTLKTIKKLINASRTNSDLSSEIDRKDLIFLQKLKNKEKHEQKLLKPDQTKEEYLAEKLQIDVKLLKYLMSQYSRTFNQDLKHLTTVIDFLYSRGYSNVQICTNVTILNKDIDLLKNRLEESKKTGWDKLPLSILNNVEKKFKKYLEIR